MHLKVSTIITDHDLVIFIRNLCLAHPEWRNKNTTVNHPLAGCCALAAQALRDYKKSLGEEGYRMKRVLDERNEPHYFVLGPDDNELDPTAEQYTDLGRPLPYNNGYKSGSPRPFKAAKIIVEELKKERKRA